MYIDSLDIEQLYKIYYETTVKYEYSFFCICPISEYSEHSYTFQTNKDSLVEKITIDAYSKIRKHRYQVNSYITRIVCSRDTIPTFLKDEVVCLYSIDRHTFFVTDKEKEIEGRCVYVFMKKV